MRGAAVIAIVYSSLAVGYGAAVGASSLRALLTFSSNLKNLR